MPYILNVVKMDILKGKQTYGWLFDDNNEKSNYLVLFFS